MNCVNSYPPRQGFSPLFRVFLLLLSLLLFGGCGGKEQKYVETRFLLGTTCNITIFGRNPDTAFEEVFGRIEEIESRMSVNISDSEVSRINRTAGKRPIEVSEDTLYVIQRGLKVSRLSGGAFDITVGPLVNLWGIGTEDARVPGDDEIESLLPLVDYRKVHVNEAERTVFLEEPGMRIDLGGVAKGYAADEAVRILKRLGVSRGIIDFGGNIELFGEKPGREPWRIGIQKPDADRGSYVGIAEVGEVAVVSSGSYERYFIEGGTRYHHILKPSTGYPVRNSLESVSVVYPGSTEADALSTAAFSLGLEEGMALIESLENAEGIFLTRNEEIILTPGLSRAFEMTQTEYSLVTAP
ncbi:MAG: FAD:protein FMN transferase [Spirochaetia bacterium]